jgi:O-antigen/teichoic acid export membrane protein
LIPLIFGPQYASASSALVCLGPANFAACSSCVSGAWLNANGRQGLYAQRCAVGAVSNVGLNLVMIPLYGIVGAAIATSLAQLTSVYLFPLLMRSTRANTRLLLCPW